jgi:hypothetical protein
MAPADAELGAAVSRRGVSGVQLWENLPFLSAFLSHSCCVIYFNGIID